MAGEGVSGDSLAMGLAEGLTTMPVEMGGEMSRLDAPTCKVKFDLPSACIHKSSKEDRLFEGSGSNEGSTAIGSPYSSGTKTAMGRRTNVAGRHLGMIQCGMPH